MITTKNEPRSIVSARIVVRAELIARLRVFAVVLFLLVVVPGARQAAAVQPSWDLPPSQQTEGGFWQEHWYEREPDPDRPRRLRINSPEVVLGEFGDRAEARENGLMLLDAPEDLVQITGAELYVELWGGHPGTANKRVTVNGRSTYQMPKVGTEDGQCTFSYPVIKLSPADLVNGRNAFQWALDRGSAFWGHAMVDQACLRFALTNRHARLVELGVAGFSASVAADAFTTATSEGIHVDLEMDKLFMDQIESVVFQGWFDGYDENGDLRSRDWHGFTLDRKPVGCLELIEEGPFTMNWDTRMLPAQKNVAVRAFIRFKHAPGLVYVTAAATGLSIPDRRSRAVHLFEPVGLPAPFWSRDNNEKTCVIRLDVNPEQIEDAELYVTTWTGGAGEVADYFTINGHHFPIAEGSGHTRQFNRLPVDPKILKKGENRIRLLSNTKDHGIEVAYPGPALMIRYRSSAR